MWYPAKKISPGDRFGRLTIITETANHRTLSGMFRIK